MFTSFKNKTKGFTLIELLVVIAIIGILSSVVLASLSTARQKSRDAKRISDLGQIQVALELFFDGTQSYSSTTPTGYTGADAGVKQLTAMKFLPQTPLPPSGSAVTYLYFGTDGVDPATSCTASPCVSYTLGVDLERADNVVLATDADIVVAAVTTFNGDGGVASGSTSCTVATGSGGERCYDLKP